jgi:two-component system sensor kinase FixL
MSQNTSTSNEPLPGPPRPVLLVVLCGLIFTIIAFSILRKSEYEKIQTRFDYSSELAVSEIQKLSTSALQMLESLKTLYQFGGDIPRDGFENFCRTVSKQYPDMLMLQWAPRITWEERQRLKDAALAEGYDSFDIWQMNAASENMPVPQREEYYVVRRVFPESGNEYTLGYDLLSGVDIRRAIEQALATRKRAATVLFHFVGENKEVSHAVAILDPVFSKDDPAVTRGVVVTLLRIEPILEKVLALAQNPHLHVDIQDSSLFGKDVCFGAPFNPVLQHDEIIDLADRKWVVTVQASSEFISESRSQTPLLVLLSGFVLTAAIGLHLRGLQRWSKRLEELSGELTGTLEDKEQTEEQYESLSEQLGLILQNIPVVCYTMRPSGDFPITYISPNVLKVIGYAPMRFQDNSSFWRSCIHPDDRAQLERILVTPWPADSFEFTYRAKVQNGKYRWIHDYMMMVRNDRNEPDHVIGIFQDITNQQEAEARIRNQNLKLEEAIEAKTREMKGLMAQLIRQEKLATVGQVSGSIAHELRNPLGAVKQSIFLLKRLHEKGKLNSEDKRIGEHLELIENELNESNHVISTFLDTIRMPVVAKRKANLRAVIYQAIERSRLAANIPVNIELDPDPLLIWADPIQLQRVFVNLLNNASDALINDDPRVDIHAEIMEEEKGEVCRIVFSDNGCGVDEDVIQNAFEPLFTTKAKGTGLGLSICRQIIVDNHGGQIAIASPAGEGTRLTITLPVSREEIDSDPSAE